MLWLVWAIGSSLGLLPATSNPVWAATGDGASVQALVEKDSVSVGEPLVLQIRVEGGDITPGTDPPDTSAVVDFIVESLGGRSNNSSSITIVNGKMNKVESFGHVYAFRLTPKKVGKLEIPAIAVPVDAAKSRILRTEPITIRVAEPEATDDFHLELKFSKTSFYIGEPVILTFVWYIGKEVQSANFNLPILQDEAFAFTDPKVDQNPNKQVFQIPIGGANVLADKGAVVRNGKEFTTLSFRKVLFAKQAGTFAVPEATVSCNALVGYSRQPQQRGPFNRFFDDDFFNPGGRGVYKTFVARSQPVSLTVAPLPEQGKPEPFTGCVGQFQVATAASPLEVSIGDPITLSVSISGSEYLDHVELPALAQDPAFDRDFKIPEERAAGVVRGNAKEFTQTLRAKSTDVTTIPPVRFSYFNPATRSYEIAQSKPIGLTVRPAKVLTSADVEGRSEEAAVKRNELENWSKGIAYNYEGAEVLERQSYRISTIARSPLWLALTCLPLLAFVGLLVFTRARHRRLADPGRLRSRKAFAGFKRKVQLLARQNLPGIAVCSALLEAVRDYLGDKLGNNGSALTLHDVREQLESRGISSDLAQRLSALFDACERGSYGGMDVSGPDVDLTQEALEVIRLLDRVL